MGPRRGALPGRPAITIPPLRERSQDVPLLVDFFLRRGGRAVSVTPGALQKLCAYRWPGNVRELENTVERARVLAPGEIIDEAEIQLPARRESAGTGWADGAPIEDGWKNCVAKLERSLVERAMSLAAGNKSKAAEMLQIHRRLLYEKLREYGMKVD